MASSVEDKVKQIIVEQLGVDESEVTPTAFFIDESLSWWLALSASPRSVDDVGRRLVA